MGILINEAFSTLMWPKSPTALANISLTAFDPISIAANIIG
jgi:hypothetical protein